MTAKRESDLLITSMITDWIGRHDVLLPINQNYDKIRGMNKASIAVITVISGLTCKRGERVNFALFWPVRLVYMPFETKEYLTAGSTVITAIKCWTILKRRYECWKSQKFTQQSALQQRAQNGTYCLITSMTCANVQLMLKSGCW